jgi:cell division protein FtsZ
MSFSIEFADESAGYDARIKVIGCGGSGGNAVNTMMNFGLEGVEFMVVNTDAQALAASSAPLKLHIGANVTRGLGAGADPEKGRKAALEDVQRIKEVIQGADMVFVTAGMGGGTGTGAAPVIAQLAREEGCLTVGVVTKPFFFEGKQRARRAELGLAMLSEHVDTLITIPNQKLLSLGDEDLSFIDAFRKADEVLYQAIKGISDLITQNGIVNVDFADVKTVMSNMGRALMGTGCAKGQGRARLAAEMAVSSPLLDDISVEGATGVLINIVGGPDMRMREIEEAATLVQEMAHEDANIIFGAVVDPALKGKVKITVIATGFGAPGVARAAAPAAASSSITPVDMTEYAEHARTRTDSIAVASASSAPRLSFGRRPLLDLTNASKPAASASAAAATAAAAADHDAVPDGDRTRAAAGQAAATDPDFDLSSTFDVPAFLRRQEG